LLVIELEPTELLKAKDTEPNPPEPDAEAVMFPVVVVNIPVVVGALVIL